ncbi:hypothetical protein SCOR_04555 [Sulfidibacter corallicola]|uniref:Uncharacterized protein n=1 Tax=Sulfidibacter corallicola TaxID=2818388 RepID=A0A8A4TS23_SULCO|nr:hypothetical protein [Sulfidibacter corallicola]QTD51954.1 hypothetical protein J3U87_05730 [Sulfidibacter corallicola]
MNTAYGPLMRMLQIGFIGAVALTGVAYVLKGSLGEPSQMQRELLQEPVQNPTDREEFMFHFAGTDYAVIPLADYEMWGLVVTHNNTQGIADIYHDASSVDTKDICVVWGDNITTGGYQHAEFWSGPWTCYWRSSIGVEISPLEISNNHLLTADPQVRERIADVRVGDQVYVRGMLVGYHPVHYPNYVRNSSLTREDTGNGACEVLFVEDIEILQAGTPFWYFGFRFGLGLCVLFPIAMLLTMSLQVRARPRPQYSSRWGEYSG